ncbi:hypothetical protein DOTSEDRAFT_75510 [Dothistroma septosporum NZE10]|uniref:PAC domain-containing protein n=1 Tax=Dothistroma septosporum (strain NZE10 / CBS 128990) TaxID=675120 RepID=M2WIJ8_DOTSN|nr:hypothetical protein DOTSEDRAFT_75510 [Dothistroma septosporum NZE10]
MPIPDRVSSAKRSELERADSATGSSRPARSSGGSKTVALCRECDDVSLKFSEFDDGLLQPRSSVIGVQGNTPVRGRSRVASAPGPQHRAMSNRRASIHDHIDRASLASEVSEPSATPATLGLEALFQLQSPSPDKSGIANTELEVADDETSWNLIKPSTEAEERNAKLYSLEKRAEQLYSKAHLRIILQDPELLSKFSNILRKCRPWRVQLLTYYLAASKAQRALDYANSLATFLSSLPYDGESHPSGVATNPQLEVAAQEAFNALLKDDLHYYITHTWIKAVSMIVQRRITGTLPVRLLETSNGLAEVFCITDPNRKDNPIILASEAFTRHSGCSLEYVLGRNCRFMQGPGTTVDSCRRFAVSCQENKDHTEIFVNYRRDGSPFLSLVMNAPLMDSDGNVRYFLGAQVDVSGLVKNCSGMESLSRLVEQESAEDSTANEDIVPPQDPYADFQALSDTFDSHEIDMVRKTGGSLHRCLDKAYEPAGAEPVESSPRVVLEDSGAEHSDQDLAEDPPQDGAASSNPSQLFKNGGMPGNLSGVYKYYLLIRPYPSLRILFTSPTLRAPGTLQSHFLHRIGGSARMRSALEKALKHRKNVTARVRWLNQPDEEGKGEGKARWIHCTPLIHYSGQVGLWMVVVVPPLPDANSVAAPVVGMGKERFRVEP